MILQLDLYFFFYFSSFFVLIIRTTQSHSYKRYGSGRQKPQPFFMLPFHSIQHFDGISKRVIFLFCSTLYSLFTWSLTMYPVIGCAAFCNCESILKIFVRFVFVSIRFVSLGLVSVHCSPINSLAGFAFVIRVIEDYVIDYRY